MNQHRPIAQQWPQTEVYHSFPPCCRHSPSGVERFRTIWPHVRSIAGAREVGKRGTGYEIRRIKNPAPISPCGPWSLLRRRAGRGAIRLAAYRSSRYHRRPRPCLLKFPSPGSSGSKNCRSARPCRRRLRQQPCQPTSTRRTSLLMPDIAGGISRGLAMVVEKAVSHRGPTLTAVVARRGKPAALLSAGCARWRRHALYHERRRSAVFCRARAAGFDAAPWRPYHDAGL